MNRGYLYGGNLLTNDASLASGGESVFVYCKRRVQVMQATSLPFGCIRLQAGVK